MRIVRVQMDGKRDLKGLKMGLSVLCVGDPCDPAYGGGKVKSMEFDEALRSLVVRKDCRFVHSGGVIKPFDVAIIPWEHVQQVDAVDEPQAQQQGKPR